MNEEHIKFVQSRPHHPQTNGCLERYHSEVHKYMYNYLKVFDDFDDEKVNEALCEYILYHNSGKENSTKFCPNDIRDTTDVELINIISQNIIKSIKYHIINDNELLDENEKSLLWDNMKFNKGKYFKNSNN